MTWEERLTESGQRWLAEAEASPEQILSLADRLRRHAARRRWWRAGGGMAVALALALGALFWPQVLSLASDAPGVGPLIARLAAGDRGLQWAAEQGYVVPLGLSASASGYTLHLDSYVADTLRTELFYRIDGPGLTPARFTLQFKVTPGDWSTGGMHWSATVEDGRVVGRISLPPLPHTLSRVRIEMTEVGGVKGDWSLRFLASRAALSRLSRDLQLQAHLRGPGYDLTVTRLILAPTETVVEMAGQAQPSLEFGHFELVADGMPIPSHGGRVGFQSDIEAATGPAPVTISWHFDRLAARPRTVLVRLPSVAVWRKDGPSLDLTRPGAAVRVGGVRYALVKVFTSERVTEVVLRPDPFDPMLSKNLRKVVLYDAAGQAYNSVSFTGGAPGELVLLYAQPIATPVRLEFRSYLDPTAGAEVQLLP